MMTEKQASYIKSLFSKKEYEITADVVYYTQTNNLMISKSEASAVIEYLVSCPDKKIVQIGEAAKIIIANKKKILSALNNKKKADFWAELRTAGVKFTFTNKYLYFLTEDGKVDPEQASNEQAELFIEVAKKHVRGLK